MNFKVLIIDDEQLAVDVILHYLNRFPNFEVINTFLDAVEAFNFMKENSVDIVFTDIAMPEISGMELVKVFRGQTKFIMTTSYSDFAVESFDLDVIDYLLKPFSFERFAKAIKRFEDAYSNLEIEDKSPSFFVKDGDDFIKIHIQDIDYIQGLKDYAKIVMDKKYCLVLKTLKSLEQYLKDYQFLRIHKSYIIPLLKIEQYDGKMITINTSKIPVGNTYREKLKDYLNDNRL